MEGLTFNTLCINKHEKEITVTSVQNTNICLNSTCFAIYFQKISRQEWSVVWAYYAFRYASIHLTEKVLPLLGCRMAESTTIAWLVTETDCQFSFHCVFMSTGENTSHQIECRDGSQWARWLKTDYSDYSDKLFPVALCRPIAFDECVTNGAYRKRVASGIQCSLRSIECQQLL